MRARGALVAGILSLALTGAALAQEAFPSRSVRLLVPYPAGGAVDIIGRTLGDELGRRWGHTVVIENRPGAGGVIATQALAQSPADGTTLILVAAGHALNPYFYAKLPYDSFKDFAPITLVGASPNMLLVRADSALKSIADVIAAARAKPGTLSYAHAGTGTSPHLAGELLKNLAKIDIVGVPYKGGAPSLNDLIGGSHPDELQQRSGIDRAGEGRHGALARRHHGATLARAVRRAIDRRNRAGL